MSDDAYRGQYNNAVRMTGDWTRARRTFDGLGWKVNKATDRTMAQEAELIARRMRANLTNQVYAEEGHHAPLAESTNRRKKNQENVDKILLDTEEFVNAIGVYQNGYRTWLVGVQGDDKLVGRAMANEVGAPERNLPARPVFRIEIERIKANGRLHSLESAFARILQGKVSF